MFTVCANPKLSNLSSLNCKGILFAQKCSHYFFCALKWYRAPGYFFWLFHTDFPWCTLSTVSTQADCVLAEACHSLTISATPRSIPLPYRGQEDLTLSSRAGVTVFATHSILLNTGEYSPVCSTPVPCSSNLPTHQLSCFPIKADSVNTCLMIFNLVLLTVLITNCGGM